MVETRSKTRSRYNIYNWLKENNMLVTESQLKKLGLKPDHKQVIFHEYIYGYDETKVRLFALAPEGYRWVEDLDMYKEVDDILYALFKEEREKEKNNEPNRLEFYRKALCVYFMLEKL